MNPTENNQNSIAENIQSAKKNGKKFNPLLILVILLAIASAIFAILYFKGRKNPEEPHTESESSEYTTDEKETTPEKKLQSISVETEPKKLFYHLGDDLNALGLSGLSLTVEYEGEVSRTIDEGYTVFPEKLTESGTQEVKVYYGDRESSFHVVVSPSTTTAFEIETLPVKMTYYQGEDFDATGLLIRVYYSDGTSEVLETGYRIEGFSSDTAGIHTVTVIYQELTVTFTVTILEASLTKISVIDLPEKQIYYEGEVLDLTGLHVLAEYDDGTEEILETGFTITEEAITSAGKKTITVKYGNQTVTFLIEVLAERVETLSILTEPEITEYYVGDTLDFSSLSIRIKYSDGTSTDKTSGFTCSPSVFNTAGTHSVTVSYGNYTVGTFTVNVKEVTISEAEVCTNPIKTIYNIGDTFDLSGFSLTVTYSNGRKKTVVYGFEPEMEIIETAEKDEVVVVYEGIRIVIKIIINEARLTSVTLKTKPVKLEYYVGDMLDLSGLELTGAYENNTTKTITEGYEVNVSKLTEAGNITVTVTYCGQIVTFIVVVHEVTITSVEVKEKPEKLVYEVGDTIDTSGIELIVTYSNQTTKTVTSGYSVNVTALNTAGTVTVTVTYEGKTATFTVTVKAKEEPQGTALTSDVKVGDFVKFGPYTWRVLDKQNGKALIITEQAIACRKYNETYTGVTWETCTLRSWLNNTFIKEFTSKEQSVIATTTVINSNNPDYGTAGGNTTYDKIFLLSIDEANRYFSSPEDRMCVPNANAKAQGIYQSIYYKKGGEGTCLWWLRSPGYCSGGAADVHDSGDVYTNGGSVDHDCSGVRPALWVNLGEPEPSVTGISIESMPGKTVYEVGETLNTSGLALTVTYSNQTTKTVTSGYSVNVTALNTAGTVTVTVTYEGKTATFTVTVKAKEEPQGTALTSDVKVGDFVKFGPYTWRVLDKQNGKALIITEQAIACKRYNETYTDVTWETCTLRSWLNNTFIKEFTSKEQSAIATTAVINDNNLYGTAGGNTTYDKIFLLSIDEANRYFSSHEDRRCVPNANAKAQGCDQYSYYKKGGEGTCLWWLRSPGRSSYDAASVSDSGGVFTSGDYVGYDYFGVRPALWVNLGS